MIKKRKFFYQIKVIMMENYDQSVEINHNPNWHYIPDHPYRIVVVGGSRLFTNNLNFRRF